MVEKMADVKPATDVEIDAIRAGLPSTAFLFSPAHQVMMLIARIDAERAARERAENALRRIDSLLPDPDHLSGMADAALRGLLLMIGDQVAAERDER